MLMLTVVSGVVSQREWSQQPSPMPGEEHMTGVKVKLAPEGIMTVSTEMNEAFQTSHGHQDFMKSILKAC